MSEQGAQRAATGRAVARAKPPQSGMRWLAKRAIDIIGSIAGLALSLPVLAICAVAIFLDDGRPILYRGTRLGRYGRPFQLLKLRTMVAGADDYLHREFIAAELTGAGDTSDERIVYKIESDPRLTRVGRFLRRTSLDELPQLVNVLKGEMSLVGPRPEVAYAVAHYQPHHHRRFDVIPGITGLWQVSGRSRLTPLEMLELDVEYADRWSVVLDLQILVRTIPAMFSSEGAGA